MKILAIADIDDLYCEHGPGKARKVCVRDVAENRRISWVMR